MFEILQPLATAGFGALAKIVSWKVQQSHKDRSMRDLIVLKGYDSKSVATLQSGSDTADEGTRRTRRLLALLFSGTFCFVIIWFVINPTFVPSIELVVPQKLPFLWKWFGLIPKTEQTVIEISFLTSFVMSFKVIMEFLVGFYFTKMGK